MKIYKDKEVNKNVKNIFFINVWRKSVFDIYFTEFGTALTTILPMLFQYCYKYYYSDSRIGSKCICFNDLKIKQATFAKIFYIRLYNDYHADLIHNIWKALFWFDD